MQEALILKYFVSDLKFKDTKIFPATFISNFGSLGHYYERQIYWSQEMHFSMQVEFHTPLMTFDASDNVTCLTSPNPHCTFLNLLHLPIMVGTKLISLPLTTMIRLKYVS